MQTDPWPVTSWHPWVGPRIWNHWLKYPSFEISVVPFLVGMEPTGWDLSAHVSLFFMINAGLCAFRTWVRSKSFGTMYGALLFYNNQWALVCLNIVSGPSAKPMEGTPVDAPHPTAHREGTSPTHWDDTLWVTTPIEMGSLTDSLSKVLVENPQRQTLEGPMIIMRHEVNKLDVGLHQHLYCLQLDVVLIQDLSRPPPPQYSWTTAAIWDMVARDTPNIKECIILGPGSAILFFGHHQEPQEGLYLHDAQELAKEITKTTTWMGQPVHQQVFPITIAEAWLAISMSLGMSEHCDWEGPIEMVWQADWEVVPMSSWTDEDEDGDTHPSSPTLLSTGGRWRRCSCSQCRAWMPLPHFMGLGHSMNPIPYPSQLNFPPPP